MPEIDCTKIEYHDFNEVLRKYSKEMKEDKKCDLIIALNHMRVPDDRKMAASNDTSIVDMIFGGHDHSYLNELNTETGIYV